MPSEQCFHLDSTNEEKSGWSSFPLTPKTSLVLKYALCRSYKANVYNAYIMALISKQHQVKRSQNREPFSSSAKIRAKLQPQEICLIGRIREKEEIISVLNTSKSQCHVFYIKLNKCFQDVNTPSRWFDVKNAVLNKLSVSEMLIGTRHQKSSITWSGHMKWFSYFKDFFDHFEIKCVFY